MRALRVYSLIIAMWIVAWALKVALDPRVPWVATSTGAFLYWTAAKVAMWLCPAYWLLRASRRTLGDVLNVAQWKRWGTWGAGIGLAIALTGWIPKALSGHSLFASEPGLPLLNALLVAPLFEEFLTRGALLGALQDSLSFWRANTVAAAMFLGLHLPGWYFTGSLGENLRKPVGGALSIFLLGLAFGYAARRGRSVLGASVAHFLNNLGAA